MLFAVTDRQLGLKLNVMPKKYYSRNITLEIFRIQRLMSDLPLSKIKSLTDYMNVLFPEKYLFRDRWKFERKEVYINVFCRRLLNIFENQEVKFEGRNSGKFWFKLSRLKKLLLIYHKLSHENKQPVCR